MAKDLLFATITSKMSFSKEASRKVFPFKKRKFINEEEGSKYHDGIKEVVASTSHDVAKHTVENSTEEPEANISDKDICKEGQDAGTLFRYFKHSQICDTRSNFTHL